MADKTVVLSHMQNKSRTNYPDFLHTVIVQEHWFVSIDTCGRRMDIYQFYHLYKAASPRSPGTWTQQGKQQRASTNLAVNHVRHCLCTPSWFKREKAEVVHKGISLTLAGVSVKEEEMIQHF